MIVLAAALTDSLEAKTVLLTSSALAILFIGRLLIKFDRIFISDAEKKIKDLRVEVEQNSKALDLALEEVRACKSAHAATNLILAAMHVEIAELRSQLGAT